MADIISYLRSATSKILEFREIAHTENMEIDLLKEQQNIIFNNVFVSYANEAGIERYEKMLELPKEVPDGLRRYNILSKLWNRLPYNYMWLNEKLIAICEGSSFFVRIENYSLEIDVPIEKGYVIEKLESDLRKEIPCNLTLCVIALLLAQIDLATTNKVTIYKVPACNTIRCGTYPIPSKVGLSIQTQISTSTKTNLTTTNPRICGTYPKQSTLGYIVQVSNNKTVHAGLATTDPRIAGSYPTQAIIGTATTLLTSVSAVTTATKTMPRICGKYKCGEE